MIKEDLATTATPHEDNSINETMSHAHLPNSEEKKLPPGQKKKFNFADLFKDEGMFHSVNGAYLKKENKRGHGIIKTPMDEIERYEEE